MDSNPQIDELRGPAYRGVRKPGAGGRPGADGRPGMGEGGGIGPGARTQVGAGSASGGRPGAREGAGGSGRPGTREGAGLASGGRPGALVAVNEGKIVPPPKNGKAPLDAAEIERQGLLLREVSMRKERNKARRRYFLMIFVAFLFALALIYRYSTIIEINESILKEKATLAKLENENSLLQKQIGAEIDLEKIKLLAESKLDMQKPDKDQIVYIKVAKKDHALVASQDKPKDTETINPFAYLLEQARIIQERLFAE